MWGYLTAGVVAANVAANLVNNANENNNNNNNNNNQDNTNNNNMNVGNSANMNTNMNMLLPGKRSISSSKDLVPVSALRTFTGLALGSGALYTGDMWRHLQDTLSLRETLNRLFCTTLSSPREVFDVNDVLLKITKIALGLLTSDLFQNVLSFEQALDYSLEEESCQ